MKYIWANFVTTIKDWSCILIEDWKLSWACLDKLDSFKFSPYLSDLVLYSIQSKREWKNSEVFPNLYENDLLNIVWESRNIFKKYFSLDKKYKSVNFEEKSIFDYKNKHAYYHVLWTHMISWFDNSVWLCIDYLWYNDNWNHQVQTIWNCVWNKIDLVDDFDTSLTINRWIWFTYSIFADMFDIYKYDVPFLAVYWNKDRFKWVNIYEYKNNNVYLRKEFLESITLNSDLLPKTFYASIEELNSNMDNIYFNIKKIFNISDLEIIEAKKDLRKWVIADLFAYVENETKKAVVYLAKKAYNTGKSKKLTVSGWLASNHLLCKSLIDETEFRDFYFELSPNYTGISIWAAFELYWKKILLEKTWYGKEYTNNQIKADLDNYNDYISYSLEKNTKIQNDFIIEKLIDKKIIWYFKWWSELWPRSLWNRSILTSCFCEDLSDRLRVIKKRQNWKSFSVSVLEEDLWKYFKSNYNSRFMSVSWILKDKFKKDFIWVNLDNNVIRYQSVWEKNNLSLYSLLKQYKQKTNNSFLLNTSLNSYKQPIVETPTQAIELFLSSRIDYLILWDFIVSKNKLYKEFSFNYKNLKKQKNIQYFSINHSSYKNYLNLKNIIEKIVLKDYDMSINDIKYFERDIDIEFAWNKLLIEKVDNWKTYDLKTKNIWIMVKQLNSKKDLAIFYKKLLLVDKKIKEIFDNWDYFLKDLINYL